jgi:hypothetical protein
MTGSFHVWLCVRGLDSSNVTHDFVKASRSFHDDYADLGSHQGATRGLDEPTESLLDVESSRADLGHLMTAPQGAELFSERADW